MVVSKAVTSGCFWH